MLQFPKNFLWGAATSSYQVEGNNINSDWWPWEIAQGKEQSGLACRHYELYEGDFDIAKSLNHNAHRLSIEWARIEPRQGEFSDKELKHYVDVIVALKARGIEPMVTLHHFTNPIWFSQLGGWESRRTAEFFTRYCEVVVGVLAQHVRYWITINEPTIYSSHAYIFGTWPPQVKSFLRAKKVQDHQIQAHIKAYRRIHKIYEEHHLSKPAVGISHHMPAIVACQDNFKNRLAVYLRDQVYNYWVLDGLRRSKTMDFIGLNYYSRHLVEAKNWSLGSLLWDTCQDNHRPLEKNFLGWDIYPQGLQQVLLKLKKYNLPVFITENGICASDDGQRWQFIHDHLKNIALAIKQGVDVRGYLYWSLLDNFEWHNGYGPRFGIVDVNYLTFQRTLRESAKKFAQVCKNGILE